MLPDDGGRGFRPCEPAARAHGARTRIGCRASDERFDMDARSTVGILAMLLAFTNVGFSTQTPASHAVSAPASDISSGLVRLPDPAASATSSAAALIPVRFAPTERGRRIATVSFEVERAGDL